MKRTCPIGHELDYRGKIDGDFPPRWCADCKFAKKVATDNHVGHRLTFPELVRLAREAGPKVERHRQFFQRSMGIVQARTIRAWRVDQHYTWRSIAAQAYHLLELGVWPPWPLWGPPSNQLVDMTLSDVAAKFFQEDFMAPPWD